AALAIDNSRLLDAMRREEARFRVLVQNISDLILLIDVWGRILYTSPAAERMLGYDGVIETGTDVFEFVHPDDRAEVQRLSVEGARQPGAAPAIEMRVRHADGTYRYMESVSNNLVRDPTVGGFVVTLRDITDRRRAADELAARAHQQAVVA